jgi:hypothetical protein
MIACFLLAFAVADITIGQSYNGQCPLDNRIPQWLVVKGSIGLITLAVFLFVSLILLVYGHTIKVKLYV